MAAFIASLVVRDRECLVVGGDREAAEKAARLVEAGARVRVVAPVIVQALHAMAQRQVVRWSERAFDPAMDLVPAPFVVISTVLDDAFSERLHADARAVGAIVCCVDQPARCDFFHTAQGAVGALSLAVASEGRAPALARALRDQLVAGLDAPMRTLSEALVALRAETPREARRGRMAEALRDLRVEVRVHLPAWLRARD